MVYKVVKPVYGITQAGRRWQRTLFPWMLEQGFTQCQSDPCVFYKERPGEKGTEKLIVGVYVDDLWQLY